MGITATALTTGSDTTNQTTAYATASITPSANQPVLVAVLTTVGSGSTPTASVSGCGLTWTLVDNTTIGSRTAWLFLGIGASPTTGALSIAGDGTTTTTSCLWQVTQLAGVATAVANGVVQSVNAKPGSTNSLSVAFPASVTTGNATFGMAGTAVAEAPAAGTGWTSMGSTTQSAPTSGLIGEFAGAAQQNITASWTTASNSFVVGAEFAAASTGGTNATASGPVARVTVTAPAGSVTTTGGRVTLNGPVASVQVSAPVGSVSIVTPHVAPPITLSWPVPDWFTAAVRSSYALSYTVDAYFGNTPVSGATGMQPVGGQVTDTIRPGVRRTLSVDLTGGKTVYDLLAPTGTTLKATAHVTMTNQQVVNVPMGQFVIDQVSLDESTGKVSVTAPDRWVLIQRAKFMGPASSSVGMRVTDQIVTLIQGALGSGESVTVTATSRATVGALTWQKDRDKAITDLAASIGAWVFCDRNGHFIVADVPTISASASWLVDSSPSGVLISLDRQKTRTSTYNVVVVDSSSSSTPSWSTQYAFDSDPASPTYAGPDPVNHPELAGEFGVSPYFYSDPNLASADDALRAARAILSRTVGVSSSVSLTQVPNPALDAFDAIDVLPPGRVAGRRPASGGLTPGAGVSPGGSTYPDGGSSAVSWSFVPQGLALERHVADTVTHSLDPAQPLQIQGRSTRSDLYT